MRPLLMLIGDLLADLVAFAAGVADFPWLGSPLHLAALQLVPALA